MKRILKNCSEVNVEKESNCEDDEECDNDDKLETKTVCVEYKNKSSLNYSEYNFNVVKISTGIYYIKYLYENLESLFKKFNFDNIMNLKLIKQKDDIINDKGILSLYKKSKEILSELNKEAEDLLKNYFYYYQEDMKNTIK